MTATVETGRAGLTFTVSPQAQIAATDAGCDVQSMARKEVEGLLKSGLLQRPENLILHSFELDENTEFEVSRRTDGTYLIDIAVYEEMMLETHDGVTSIIKVPR